MPVHALGRFLVKLPGPPFEARHLAPIAGTTVPIRRTPGLSARNSHLGNYSRHKLSENVVRPVDYDEMMAALESHELLVRRFDGREILLREIDWSRLITCTVEEEKRNPEGEPERR